MERGRPTGKDVREQLLEVHNLVKHFPVENHKVIHAVNNVSFKVFRGETLALVGESGSGKTTVGRCVAGLIQPTQGTAVFGGHDQPPSANGHLTDMPNVQMVFQDAQASLNPRMNIGNVVEEPLRLRGSLSKGEWKNRVTSTLQLVGLDKNVLAKYPRHLTMGEQQRVAIARALVTRPELIILDEITSALDPFSRAEILMLLRDLQAEFSMAYMFISHDLSAVEQVSHRIAVMYLGMIVEIGPTGEVMRQPEHPYTVALLNSILLADPSVGRPKPMLYGEIPSPLEPLSGCPLTSRCPLALNACDEGVPPLMEAAPGHRTACIRFDEGDLKELMERQLR